MISRLKRFGLHEILRGGISRKVHTLRRFSRRRVAYEATGRRVMIKRGGLAFGDLAGSADSYGYNARSEVVTALREKDGSEVYGFLEDFAYDPIGNRTESAVYDENGTRYASVYETNGRNQYVSRTVPGLAAARGYADARAAVTVNGNPAFRLGGYFFGTAAFDNTESGVDAEVETYAALPSDEEGGDDLVAAVTNRVHVPQSPEIFAYDANGNQTLAETPAGRWAVEWNAENRPVRWTCGNRTLLMAYDHEGRRVRYVETTGGITNRVATFLYDGYLCIARTADGTTDRFLWDPTEPVATRPLVMVADGTAYIYAHDANKNVSELVNARTGETAAHYDYSAFGKTLVAAGFLRNRNPFRFSSEYVDDATGLTYYNWRHYDPVHGRWLSEDPIEESDDLNLYGFVGNSVVDFIDVLGNKRNPGNRRPGPPPRLPKPPPPPLTPSIPSDGSIANALSAELSRVHRSIEKARINGLSVCSAISPVKQLPLPTRTSISAAPCKCCVIAYLYWHVADNWLVYIDSIAIIKESCDDVQRKGSFYRTVSPYQRQVEYFPWR